MIRVQLSILVVVQFLTVLANAQTGQVDIQRSSWNGFPRLDFEIDGVPVLLVIPHQSADHKPWVWHGEFFDHKPEPDLELLKRGFHIAYMRVPDLLGSPQAVAHWNRCYRVLTTDYGLAKKVALVGLSRGGLYCYNWANKNPDKVACIYGDAPVCDLKSWPGGLGAGTGSPQNWQLVMRLYGFANEAEAIAFQGNPIDNLQPLASAGIPLLHVFGDSDQAVPWEENTGVLAKRYREFGGSIELISKAGVGHHPHGLDDSTPIVNFIDHHANKQFTSSQPIRIACLGDSITAGARVEAEYESYPARLQQDLGASYVVANFGLGSATLLRFGKPNIWQTLDKVRAFNPHVVIISLGTNDTVSGKRRNWEKIDDFDSDYQELLDRLLEVNSVRRVLVCTPTDMVLETSGLSDERRANLILRRPRLLQLCELTRNLVEQRTGDRVGIWELNSILTGHPELLTAGDGVHPNRAGYTAIAKSLARAIRADALIASRSPN